VDNCGKIVVLAGGPSNEREISLKSGQAVFEALKRQGQNVYLVDIKGGSRTDFEKLDADVVFIALHGKFGEDGTVQAILEELKLPYTGSGIEASKLALDKLASRKLFLKNTLKVPRYKVAKKSDSLKTSLEGFQIPFVVKPQGEGSSIGLSIVSDNAKAQFALKSAFNYGDMAIIEEYVDGRELTVGVLEDKALPVVEIITEANIYDFNAKYIDSGTQYIVPAELDKEKEEEVKKSALLAHRALGCRDFSRVDMRMDKSGNVYILEVNTIPGMTERSLLPKAAAEAGINFENLCLKLACLAYNRKVAK